MDQPPTTGIIVKYHQQTILHYKQIDVWQIFDKEL